MTTTRPWPARRKRPTNSNSPQGKSAFQRRWPTIRPNPSHPNPTTMLTTIGRNRRRGRHSPADQPVTHRTALRSHPLRRHQPATTAEHQSSPTDEDSSTDEHDAYPEPLSHSSFSDPRVNCWCPKLTRRSQVRSELNLANSEICVAASVKHNHPVAALDDGVTNGGRSESKPRHQFGRREPTEFG
jgi:hypothetical protein